MDLFDCLASGEGGHLSVAETVGYVDRALQPGPRARVERHLAGCAACRAEMVEVTRVLRSGCPLVQDPHSGGPEHSLGLRSRATLTPLVAGVLLIGTLLFGTTRVVAQSAASPAAVAADTVPPRPGDLIRLKVWREPDLSGDFAVDEGGQVVLPQLGSIPVGDMSADSVKTMVRGRLAAFLSHPAIDIAVLRRVQVVGAVQKPGLYHIDPTMTIADALALAGGITQTGRTDRVEVIRQGRKLPLRAEGRMLISQTPVQSGDQLYVPERSWVSRNTATILAALSTIAALAYVFNR